MMKTKKKQHIMNPPSESESDEDNLQIFKHSFSKIASQSKSDNTKAVVRKQGEMMQGSESEDSSDSDSNEDEIEDHDSSDEEMDVDDVNQVQTKHDETSSSSSEDTDSGSEQTMHHSVPSVKSKHKQNIVKPVEEIISKTQKAKKPARDTSSRKMKTKVTSESDSSGGESSDNDDSAESDREVEAEEVLGRSKSKGSTVKKKGQEEKVLAGEEKEDSDDDNVEDLDEEDKEDAYTALRKELSDMPFEDLQKLKEKIGVKMYNQAMYGTGLTDKSGKRVFKRDNKNRPMEMSSKRPVPIARGEQAAVKKKMSRDPRFDDLSGEYDETYFKQAYGFLTDVKQREKQQLLKELKKEKDPEKKQQIESLVKNMSQLERAEKQKESQQQRDKERKKKERELVQQGKMPFYVKKSEKKKLELAEKFRELKKHGKVENYLSKKRKKNASKDRRKLPGSGRVS